MTEGSVAILLGVVILLAATEPSGTPECRQSRWVLVGDGCVDLPCEYRAFGSRVIVDQVGGVFKSTRTSERTDWVIPDNTWWLRLPEPFRVIWKWPAIRGWHLSWSALVEWQGQRLYIVTFRDLWLMAPAANPEVLERLTFLATSYRPEHEESKCEVPQSVPPKYTF